MFSVLNEAFRRDQHFGNIYLSNHSLRSSFKIKALESNKDKHTKKLPKTGALEKRSICLNMVKQNRLSN